MKATVGGAWPWTAADDEFIRQQFKAGETFEAIAQALRRTESATKARAFKLGIKVRTTEVRTWSPADDQLLRDIIRSGKSTQFAAAQLKRSASSIRNRASKLHLQIKGRP